MLKLSRNVLLLTAAVGLATWAARLATISHGYTASQNPFVLAALVTLFGTVPPLLLAGLLRNGAANQLLVVAWRLAIMLPALALATRLEGDERKCYLIALMACYFVSLPLESWLLIRDARRTQAPRSLKPLD